MGKKLGFPNPFFLIYSPDTSAASVGLDGKVLSALRECPSVIWNTSRLPHVPVVLHVFRFLKATAVSVPWAPADSSARKVSCSSTLGNESLL